MLPHTSTHTYTSRSNPRNPHNPQNIPSDTAGLVAQTSSSEHFFIHTYTYTPYSTRETYSTRYILVHTNGLPTIASAPHSPALSYHAPQHHSYAVPIGRGKHKHKHKAHALLLRQFRSQIVYMKNCRETW
jgi:hypothetical protein